jgi:hypothetical protein
MTPYDEWKAAMLEVADRVAERRSARESRDGRVVAQRSSLIKLASTAFDLHLAAVAKGVAPRGDDGGSEPLAVALAALKTANK